MIEATYISETLINFYRTLSAASQKTSIFTVSRVNSVTTDSTVVCTCPFVPERVSALFVQAAASVFSEPAVRPAVLPLSLSLSFLCYLDTYVFKAVRPEETSKHAR